MEFVADAGLATNAWYYLAVSYNHQNKQLVFYGNGTRLKTYADVALGDMSNRDPFNIGYYENRGNSPAHCRIREGRCWTFARAPPAADTVIAAHHREAALVSEALTQAAAYSRWIFSTNHDDIADQGNNGNTLCYLPWRTRRPPASPPRCLVI